METVIRSDRVVTPWGVGSYDIGIEKEKIVAIQPINTMAGNIGRLIDATGKIVIPGGVEPHAHAGHTRERKSDIAAPPYPMTRAAVFGGTTTIVDFAHQPEAWVKKEVQARGKGIHEAIKEKSAIYQGNSFCDYTFHCRLVGNPSAEVLAQLGEAIDAGMPSVKVFTTNSIPPPYQAPSFMLDMGHVIDVMELVAAHGGMLMVHAEDEEIVMHNYDKLKREGRTEWWNLHLVHSNLSEDVSTERVIRAARRAGAAIYFAHLSAKEAAWNVRDARIKGLPVYGETLPNYVSFAAQDYREQDGMKYHVYPSLKVDDDREALWEGLIKGHISTMATDEWSTSYAKKTAGKTIFDAEGGQNGIETRVPITYTEGVVKRGMSLQRFVNVVSTNAARITGLYPRKGVIAPGGDADIVFIDPSVHKKLSMEDLHAQDYSIFEGWEVFGWTTFTMLRGKVMVDNGKLLGDPGDGRFLTERKIDPAVLRGPAC